MKSQLQAGPRLREIARQSLSARRPTIHSIPASGPPLPTFLIPHCSAPQFLKACLHAIRRHHPDARILVADAKSPWIQYLEAKRICAEYGAEVRLRLPWHGHTALLNYLLCQVEHGPAVFLDQDCILLNSLDPLLQEVQAGRLLVGPQDSMRLTNPNLGRTQGQLLNRYLRVAPDFIHASLMVTPSHRIRAMFGDRPFYWRRAWNRRALGRMMPVERYYGLCERIRQTEPGSVLALESRHSVYGLGMIYYHADRPLAYHNWYSGRIFGRTDQVDSLPVDWLAGEMNRFLQDYWNGALDFRLVAAGPERQTHSDRGPN